MPKLPIPSGKDVVKVLHKIGYEHIRTRGSHSILKNNLQKETTQFQFHCIKN
jgi:predicted RNA binding protein YcfA (HicA-like mRNA interferase family)